MLKLSQKPVSFEKLCGNCSHQNCCTDSQEPLLFENDILRLKSIGKFTPENIKNLSVNGINVKSIRKKRDSAECIFWDTSASNCSIYEHRPFDCRAYPFDILEIDGKFHWIVYTCNQDSDWQWSESYLEMYESDISFKHVLKNLKIFANNTQRILPAESKKTPYKILREVKNNFNH